MKQETSIACQLASRLFPAPNSPESQSTRGSTTSRQGGPATYSGDVFIDRVADAPPAVDKRRIAIVAHTGGPLSVRLCSEIPAADSLAGGRLPVMR